jgi:hypothetical protein
VNSAPTSTGIGHNRDDGESVPGVEVRDARGSFLFWASQEEVNQAVEAGLGSLHAGGHVLRIERNNARPRLTSGDRTSRVRGERHQLLGEPHLREHLPSEARH